MGEITFTHSGTKSAELSARELAHAKLARELAARGIVLLKNEGQLLPLRKDAKLALLGSGASRTVKGGTGSGDVNNRASVSIYQGLKAFGANITSEAYLSDYETRYMDARYAWRDFVLEQVPLVDNPFDAYACNPFAMPNGRAVTEEDLAGAELAVYVVSRISGEGKDRRMVAGDYKLSERELADLLFLNQAQLPTVLLINAGGAVELADVLEQAHCIKAVLNISQLGQEGGHAVADVLFGAHTPEGKLTATWAKRYEDYPYAEHFGYMNGNLDYEEYREDIYVGYRYFDTFGVKTLFPFGYGLSYTSFETKFEALTTDAKGVDITLRVENTGAQYAGREVVQLYASLPKTEISKEAHRLIGFAKTALLAPKESAAVHIRVDAKQFAVFSPERHAWLLEAGSYGIFVAEHAEAMQLVARLLVKETVVLEEVAAVCPQQNTFEILKAPQQEGEQVNRDVPDYVFAPEKTERRTYLAPLATEQSVEELIPLLYGNITEGTSALGSSGVRVPGSAGETSERLEKTYGKRSLIMADGPAGIRLRQSYEVDRETDSVYGVGVLGAMENGFLSPTEPHENAERYHQFCTAFPIGTALAQTWDVEVLKRFGEAIAVEMEEFHVDLWLAPGMNIHRNPLCGRNYEYYAEDPLLSGMLAAAVTKGVQASGSRGVTIKHFACNNQEDHRMGVDVRISERALREIYLRGFELAVKESAPVALMTSYNRINGVYSANNRDLCTVLAREEWGFDGLIMTDWCTTMGADPSTPWKCALAGNDIIMPGCPNDDESIRKAYAEGLLDEESIRRCAGRILAVIARLDG